MTRRFKLEICYNGSGYSGWQVQTKQPQVQTVQETLETAIAKIVGAKVHLSGSGRTDAGVHALYQVAAFSCKTALPPDVLTRALNATLPMDIRVWRTSEVALTFHPLRDIQSKRYRYLMSDSRPAFPFFRDYVWSSMRSLDLERMQAAAKYLLGRHDFRAFQTTGSPRKSTVRTISDIVVKRQSTGSAWLSPRQTGANDANVSKVSTSTLPEHELIAIEVEADGFLYNMVRAIAGTLYLFGRRHKGFEEPSNMQRILEKGDRSLAGPTAPANALYMIDVVYRDPEQGQ